jgi:hypothetical protein
MDRNDDRLPEDLDSLRDVAEQLVQARAAFTPLELDELRGRIERRVVRAPRAKRFVNRLRLNSIAGMAALGLMLSSGAGVVIAATSFGDSQGRGDSFGNNFGRTFGDTDFHHMRDASYCQYHGPFTKTIVIHVQDGTLIITLVFDCGHLSVHVQFIPDHSFRHGRDHHGDDFDSRFGNGQNQSWSGSWDSNAPTGTPSMTVSGDGGTYTVPFSW